MYKWLLVDSDGKAFGTNHPHVVREMQEEGGYTILDTNTNMVWEPSKEEWVSILEIVNV